MNENDNSTTWDYTMNFIPTYPDYCQCHKCPVCGKPYEVSPPYNYPYWVYGSNNTNYDIEWDSNGFTIHGSN